MNEIYPLVTCCIPCYNHELYIKDAVFSVINQDYNNIELIIIDDGSNDKCAEIISQIFLEYESRFQKFIFIARENRGLSKTLNEMLDLASGEFITFLASDDEFLPNKISSLLEDFKSLEMNYAAVFGDAEIIYDYELKHKPIYSFYQMYCSDSSKVNADVVYKDILNRNFLPAMAGLYRKECLNYIGGFDTQLRLEDWDLYLRLLKEYKIKTTSNIVARYRLHGENSIYTQNVRLLVDTIKILEKEYKYAINNNLNKNWFYKLYDTYYALLRVRAVKSISFNKIIPKYIVPYLSSKVLNKLSQRFRSWS